MSTPDVVITSVQPEDEDGLHAAWRAEQSAHRSDRPYAVLHTWPAFRTSVVAPTAYYRMRVLAARSGGETVGTATIGLADEDNQHLADLEISVVTGLRRRGIGTALFDAAVAVVREERRDTVLGEAHVPAGGGPAEAFATHLGLARVHSEDHMVVDLPVSEEHVASLRARVGDLADRYELVGWEDACPEEHVEGFCAMLTRMQQDMPLGEVDYVPIAFDRERLRADEAELAKAYRRVVAAARRRSDGAFAGYSVLFVPHGETEVIQDDTLVMPDHRGRRLGLLLKLSTLETLQRDHPERTVLHTWTAPHNHAMHRTNRTFGYRTVEVLHEMQRRLGPDPA